MSKSDHMAVFLAMTLFAIGAVALIVYQHMQATATVLGALGGSAGASGGSVGANVGGMLGAAASLAGTPIIGQDGTSTSPAVVPLSVAPGYLLN